MPLPASGPIRLGADVNTELGLSATVQISLGSAGVRGLYGVASGAIRLAADGHGKSSAFAAAITANQTNLNLRTFAVNAGWNQSQPIIITVNAGVYVYATSTGTAGMTIDGSWPGGVTVVNNGFVIGQGGNCTFGAGASGGPAISLGVNCVIINNSGAFVAGGGGAGASFMSGSEVRGGGGGGAGGGGGLGGNIQGSPFLRAGGGPGEIGGPSIEGTAGARGTGAGGGRILPGVGGVGSSANLQAGVYRGGGGGGAGGGGSVYAYNTDTVNGVFGWNFSLGGGGGGWGASGGNSGYGVVLQTNDTYQVLMATKIPNGGGGGSAGIGNQLFAAVTAVNLGGAGGQAIQRNGFTATVSGAGTTFGAIS